MGGSTTNQLQPEALWIDFVKAEDGGNVEVASHCYIGTIGNARSFFTLLFEYVQGLLIEVFGDEYCREIALIDHLIEKGTGQGLSTSVT